MASMLFQHSCIHTITASCHCLYPIEHRSGSWGRCQRVQIRVRTGLSPHGTHNSAGYEPIQSSLARPQYSMYSEGFTALHDLRVTESSSEGTDLHPGELVSLDSSLRGTSNSVHEAAAQPFQGISFEEHVLSSSSARPDEQLHVPIVQASKVKDKVKCTLNGCSALVNKDCLTRHVEEVHEGKIKAICAGCGREFKRPYQLKEHILLFGCGKS